MRHSRHLILAICAVTFAADHSRGADQAAASKIIVASRWGDLSKAEPIDIGNGVRIRLAIEDEHPPIGSRPLLYCATEGLNPDLFQSVDDDAVGPIRVRFEQLDEAGQVVAPRQSRAMSESVRSQKQSGSKIENASLLFARPLFILTAGHYRITVTKPDGAELAAKTFSAAKDRVPTWTAWEVDWQRHRTEPGGNVGEVGFVKNAAQGVAAPVWLSTTAQLWKAMVDGKPFEREADHPLPSIEKPTPGTRLTFKDGVLRVLSDEGMQARDDLNFTARWWINGRPVETEHVRSALNASGQVRRLKEYPMRLEFDAARYGAKSGDRVGLQMAYCEFGWRWGEKDLEPQLGHNATQGSVESLADPVRLTNVVEFVVP